MIKAFSISQQQPFERLVVVYFNSLPILPLFQFYSLPLFLSSFCLYYIFPLDYITAATHNKEYFYYTTKSN